MYELFEKLLKERGVTTAEVSRATGIGKSTFTGWKQGVYQPKLDKIELIAKYFDVPISYFYQGQKNERLVKLYEKNEELQRKLDELYPLHNLAAGEGAYNDPYPSEYMRDDLGEDESWATIQGDSMFPELKNGDKVRVKHQTETTKQDLTVVKVDGEHVTVKFVEIVENGVWLRAINKDVYEDHFFSVSEVMTLPIKIIGKVVEVRREY